MKSNSQSDFFIKSTFNVDGANIHLRPENFADDHTTSIVSVQEFLSHHRDIKSLALVQCTSVFMSEIYLQQGVERFRDADCVFSVYR